MENGDYGGNMTVILIFIQKHIDFCIKYINDSRNASIVKM